MKIYARQVNPEFQYSPVLDCLPFEDMALCGNRDYKEHLPEIFSHVRNVLDAGELAEILVDIAAGDVDPDFQYTDAADAVDEYLHPDGRGPYTPDEIETLSAAVVAYGCTNYGPAEEIHLCTALSVVTGHKWDYRTIRGSSQGEWQNVFFRADVWTGEALAAFEVEYFNTGSEWIVQDDGETPATPDDVEGFSLYCIAWDVDGIRAEIANAAGCKPEEVTMYKWAGVRRADMFEEV